MKRRTFLTQVTVATTAATSQPILKLFAAASHPEPGGNIDPALRNDWLTRWQQHIVGESRHRYCDNEIGEELGWLVSPFLNGFYYGCPYPAACSCRRESAAWKPKSPPEPSRLRHVFLSLHPKPGNPASPGGVFSRRTCYENQTHN